MKMEGERFGALENQGDLGARAGARRRLQADKNKVVAFGMKIDDRSGGDVETVGPGTRSHAADPRERRHS